MNAEQFDVVILGGSFSGSALGILLKRKHPEKRIAIVEKSQIFERRVGESTTEVSSCFLNRILGISNYLGHHQLQKQGLRMWFAQGSDQEFDRCVEIGSFEQVSLAGYQLDRSTFDEHLLEVAREAGCTVIRPAKVSALELQRGGESMVEVESAAGRRRLRARWIIDASGRAAIIARKQGFLRQLPEHPTKAIWARFRGVKDFDSAELQQRYPDYARACRTVRTWATNHLMGYGWWCWMIPLKGGDFSIGLVYDTRLYVPPDAPTLAGKLRTHLEQHPVARELLKDADPIEGDVRALGSLPYYSECVADDGWALIGDAAGFLDPLYSPGLDLCSYTCGAVEKMLAHAWGGERVGEVVQQYNIDYHCAYHTWFQALYRDKYYYLGDAELMSTALLLDASSYFLGPARRIYEDTDRWYQQLPFKDLAARAHGKLMAFYNSRLSVIARDRKARGSYGRRNDGWRNLFGGFTPSLWVLRVFLRGVRQWIGLEIRNFWERASVTPREAMPLQSCAVKPLGTSASPPELAESMASTQLPR